MSDTLTLLADLAGLVKAILDALASNDAAKVDEIVPPRLRTSIAKAAADQRAREKFGGD